MFFRIVILIKAILIIFILTSCGADSDFKEIQEKDKPELDEPKNESCFKKDDEIKFVWSETENAFGYEIYVEELDLEKDDDINDVDEDTKVDKTEIVKVPLDDLDDEDDPEYEVDADDFGYGIFRWHIRAYNHFQYMPSDKDDKNIFQIIDPEAPSLKGPDSVCGDQEIEWDEVDGVSRYQIQISKTNDFTDYVTYKVKGETYNIKQDGNDNDNLVDSKGTVVSDNGKYFWRIRSHYHNCKNDVYGDWSEAKEVDWKAACLPSTPTLVAPTDNIKTIYQYVKYEWQDTDSGSTNITSYDIEFSADDFATICFATTSTTTSKVINKFDVLYGSKDWKSGATTDLWFGTIKWRVKANNDAGSSDWTAPWSITYQTFATTSLYPDPSDPASTPISKAEGIDNYGAGASAFIAVGIADVNATTLKPIDKLTRQDTSSCVITSGSKMNSLQIGTGGFFSGGFAAGVAIDQSNGNIFFTDSAQGKIYKISSTGGSLGNNLISGDQQTVEPHAGLQGLSKVYNTGTSKIMVAIDTFSSSGRDEAYIINDSMNVTASFKLNNNQDGLWGAGVNANGIYIPASDGYSSVVQRYDHSGNYQDFIDLTAIPDDVNGTVNVDLAGADIIFADTPQVADTNAQTGNMFITLNFVDVDKQIAMINSEGKFVTLFDCRPMKTMNIGFSPFGITYDPNCKLFIVSNRTENNIIFVEMFE